jgi:plasmid maintenance system antidote protein VapI
MGFTFDKYEGIHPGFILERELKKRGLVKSHFAEMVKEHPQTLNAIYKGRRKLPIGLCFKIDDALSLEEGTMYRLQSAYEMKDYIQKHRRPAPELASKLRPGLFWDTDIQSLDWKIDSEAIIRRILEKGNPDEKEIIAQIYGQEKVQQTRQKMYQHHFRDIQRNLSNFGWHLNKNIPSEAVTNYLLLPFQVYQNKDSAKTYAINQANENKSNAAEPSEKLKKRK